MNCYLRSPRHPNGGCIFADPFDILQNEEPVLKGAGDGAARERREIEDISVLVLAAQNMGFFDSGD